MRTAVVCRFPVYREALAGLVVSAFGEGLTQGYDVLEDALRPTPGRPIDLLVATLGADAPDFGELKAAAAAIRPAPLVLFAALTPEQVRRAHDSGVRGCIQKTAETRLVIAALRLVRAGGCYLSEPGGSASDAPAAARLSGRQTQVLALLARGQTNKEIAQALGISVATVKLHVQSVLAVTGARNRTEAALMARGQFGPAEAGGAFGSA